MEKLMVRIYTAILLLASLSSFGQYRHTITSGGAESSSGGVFYNIVDYGAVGDNTSDNTTQIQSAINACYAAGGGRVYVPAGKFKTGKLLTYNSVTISGDGYISSWLLSNTADTMIVMRAPVNQEANFNTNTVTSNILLDGLGIGGQNLGTVGVFLDAPYNWQVNRCYIVAFTQRQMVLQHTVIGSVNDTKFYGGQYGVVASGTFTSLITFDKTSFIGHSKRAVDWSAGGQLTFYSPDIEGCGTSGDTTTGGLFVHNSIWPGVVHIFGGWAEQNFGTVLAIYDNTPSTNFNYPTTAVSSIAGFMDLGHSTSATNRNLYIKGTNQKVSIRGSVFGGAAKSVIADGSVVINHESTVLNNGTTMRGGATITQIGD